MSLGSLATETVVLIGSYLAVRDCGALRLACKPIERQLFDSFATSYFSDRTVMIEQYDLRVLAEIAHHPSFSKKLKHIAISTHGIYDECVYEDEASEALYHSQHVDQSVLFASGIAYRELRRSFTRLSNLVSVSLHDFALDRTWDRDDDVHIKRFGRSRTNHHKTSTLVENPGYLALLLAALGGSHARPYHLAVRSQRDFGIPPCSLNVLQPMRGIEFDRIANVLGHIKILELELSSPRLFFDFETGQHVIRLLDSPWDGKESLAEAQIRRFLHRTSRIEDLRLKFNMKNESFPNRFVEWLGMAIMATSVTSIAASFPTPTIELEYLTSVQLSEAAIGCRNLVSIPSRFSRLTTFRLYSIELTPRHPDDLGDDRWSFFFRYMAVHLSTSNCLKIFVVGDPSQLCTEHDHEGVSVEVYFAAASPDNSEADIIDQYTLTEFDLSSGQTIYAWLETQSVRTVVANFDPGEPHEA